MFIYKYMATIKPRAEYVLVTPIALEEKTAAGIYRPDAADEKSVKAQVLAVGSDVKELKKGDIVICKQYESQNFILEGTEYQILKERDVLATIS